MAGPAFVEFALALFRIARGVAVGEDRGGEAQGEGGEDGGRFHAWLLAVAFDL